MSSLELLTYLVDSCGKQLFLAIEGIDPSHKDFRLHEGGFSFAEQVGHVSEAYTAVIATSKGEKYEWGSFKPASDDWSGIVAEMKTLREQATKIVLVEDEERLKMGADYIVMHDLYHVGQIATMRLNVTPDWDAYAIYA